MAETKMQIRLNYHTAVRQADEIREMAGTIRRQSERDLSDTIREVSQRWRGNTAGQYLEQCRTLQQQMTETAESLSQTADTMKRIAGTIRDAELSALTLAEQRSYQK